MNTISFTADQFFQRIPLMPNHLNPDAPFGGFLFETFGAEWAHIKQYRPQRVWTLITDDEGGMLVVSGFRFANRLGYFLSKATYVPSVE
jgi:hypothetical protein